MKCIPCPENCKECDIDTGRCRECVENYLYNLDTHRCEVQQRDSNGVVICLRGYYNYEGLCLQSAAFCTDCDTYGTCTACEDGYYVDTYEAYYVSQVQCNLCPLPCKTCKSANECI